jgi:hypothetical protein
LFFVEVSFQLNTEAVSSEKKNRGFPSRTTAVPPVSSGGARAALSASAGAGVAVGEGDAVAADVVAVEVDAGAALPPKIGSVARESM